MPETTERISLELELLDSEKKPAIDTVQATIEAVLFLETSPILPQKIASICHFPLDIVQEALGLLRQKYQEGNSGISLVMVEQGYILCPKKDIWESLKNHYGKKNENKLSLAALETLGIIANNQPVTRSDVEALRGVSADNMIRLLLERKFIQEAGKKDVPGKPTLYATTQDFLDYFHLKSIADLPKLDERDEQRFTLAR